MQQLRDKLTGVSRYNLKPFLCSLATTLVLFTVGFLELIITKRLRLLVNIVPNSIRLRKVLGLYARKTTQTKNGFHTVNTGLGHPSYG